MKKFKKDYETILKKDFTIKSNIFLYLMFSIFLLLIEDYKNVTLVKYSLFLLFTAIFIFSILFSLGGMFLAGYRIRYKLDKTLFLKPEFYLIMHMLWSVVSFLFSPYRNLRNGQGKSVFLYGSGRYDGFLTLLLYIAIFILLSFCSDFNIKHVILICITTILMCIIAFIQFCGINFLNFYPVFNGQITKFVSTMGNLGMFAGLLCMVIPIMVTTYIFLENSPIINFLLCFSQLISLYILFVLGANSGKVAVVVVLLIFAPFTLNKAKNIFKLIDFYIVLTFANGFKKIIQFNYIHNFNRTELKFIFNEKILLLIIFTIALFTTRLILTKMNKSNKIKIKHLRIFAIILMIVVFAFLMFLNYYIPEERTSFEIGDDLKTEISNLSQGKINDAAGSHRIGVWRNALNMGKNNFLFGTGIGTFLKTFTEYTADAPVAGSGILYDTAHNEYIHLFCTVGIVGLLTYLGFLLSIAIKGFKNIYKNPYIIILGSAVLSYCVHAFFSFSIVIVTPIFWIFIGLLYNKIKLEELKK